MVNAFFAIFLLWVTGLHLLALSCDPESTECELKPTPGSGRIPTMVSGSNQIPDLPLAQPLNAGLGAGVVLSPFPAWHSSECWRGRAEQRAATDSADRELNDQRSCDVSVHGFRPGRGQLQHYTTAAARRWVCMLVFLTTPNFAFKQCVWKPMH